MNNARKMTANIKRFWENTSERNAHLALKGGEEFFLKRAEDLVGKFPVKGKKIIDFGCGGGYIGKYVLEHGAKRYVAYDVAKRSIDRMIENTQEYADKVEYVLLQQHRWDFTEYKPDMIVALAVIIHFPTTRYMDNFLNTCEKSGAKYLVLEIRNRGRGTTGQRDPYSAACFKPSPQTCLTIETTPEHVSEMLPSYELVDKTDPAKAPTQCQVLWYRKKKKRPEPEVLDEVRPTPDEEFNV